MQWWAWIVVGAVLLGSELFFIDAQFYLVFVGAAALIVGAATLAMPGLAAWVQWVAFLGLAAVAMSTFRRWIFERVRRGLPPVKGGPAGDSVVVGAGLRPGESCRIEYRGTTWNAVNGGRSEILAGGRARIARVEGLTLVLHGED
jgi:membrane protein implicated in regulation of membrane protease activity